MVVGITIAAALVLPFISFVFFRKGSELALGKRLLASAHGILVALILPYGLAIDGWIRGEPALIFQAPVFLLLLLGAASMLYSIWIFRSRPVLLLAHLVTLAVAVPITFIGLVAVVGWT